MNEQMKKGAVASYLLIACNILSVLLYTPFLLRALGRSSYAVYMLLNAFLSYFAVDFGLGSSLAKFITDCKYKTDCNYTEKELLAVVWKAFFALSVVLAFVVYLVYQYLELIFTGLTKAELICMQEAYQVAAAYFVFAFAMTPLEGIFTANEYFSAWKLTVLLQKMCSILLAASVLLMGFGIQAVVTTEAVSGMLTILLRILYLVYKRALQIDIRYWNIGLLKQILKFSVWMAALSFAQRFIIPITPSILGHFADSREIAVFSIASTLEGYIYLFGSVIGSLFLPHISRLVNAGRQEEIDRIQVQAGRIQLFITGAVLLAFIDFGKEFIFLWAGDGYDRSYEIVLLIGMSNLVYVTQQIAFSVLIVIGKVKYGALVYMLSALCSTVLSCLLTSKYGAIGAGIAICVCLWGFSVIVMSIIYQKIAGVDMIRLLQECHLKILPYYGCYGLIWLLLNKVLPGYSWKALIVKGIVWTFGLAALLWIKVMDAGEKQLCYRR